ncbi:MAG: prephenate dehydratase [Alphaproteobacteria bacterium]|nr:prephenate dehydratase [Alphaproteobacteria bacterium]
MSANLVRLIAFQGVPGAYSDLACRTVFPGVSTLPCRSFEDAFAAVAEGNADLAMIPIENSHAGRVTDVHYLLPSSGLHIVAEHFHPVDHMLLAPKGATLAGLKSVRSHIQGLQQCRKMIRELGLEPVVTTDTAGAAAEVAAAGDPTQAAISSSLAGEIYGLDVMRRSVQDASHNTTRFVVLSRTPDVPDIDDGPAITTLVFRVRNVPASLYKAMGGFATNGINLSKLESYMVGGRFVATQFFVDADGHPDSRAMRLALEELRFFTKELKILGVYRASPFRADQVAGE